MPYPTIARLLPHSLLVLVAACSGASASELLPGDEPAPRPSLAEAAPGQGASEPAPIDPSSARPDAPAAGSQGADASAPAPAPDAGTPAPAIDAFTGAAAYAATTGPNARKSDHPFANGNPAKQSCLASACHGAGGGGPRFFAGGTVYKDVAGTQPAAQIEVRVRDAAGKALRAYTDADGNFFLRGDATTTPSFPALTGARAAAITRPMITSIGSGDCNSSGCHGGAAGPIHVP